MFHPVRWLGGGNLVGADRSVDLCPICDNPFDAELDCMCPTCRQNQIWLLQQREREQAERDEQDG